jgi:multidrug resistance efflux pump
MLLLAAVLITAFLPYTYETGGEVKISPAARGIASARTEGEIVEVLVTQGQVVRKGDVLARLSDWDQVSDLAVTEAQLAGAVARLAQIEAGAQPEEIELERAKVARAEAIATFKEAEVDRARELSTSETISRAALEKAEEDYATALADLEVARANLALVEGGATEEEREIAQADVQRLTAELDFRQDELERTRIVAPIDGRVVTPDLHLRTGDYLRPGDLLLEIEEVSEVTATIAIPEADVGLIAPGQTVRLKLRGNSAVEVQGVVESVAPIAEDAGYGRIVRATAVFPNPDGLILSEMTGWAKIQGVELTVWEAYLRTILRFGQIDIWSWIP